MKAETFVQLVVKDPYNGKTRPIQPGQPWHILSSTQRTLCGRTLFTAGAVSTTPGRHLCKRCQERQKGAPS